MRSVIGGHQDPARARQLPLLSGEPGRRARGELFRLARLPCRERGRQCAPLPELVMIDLGHRGPETVRELRLRREDMLALAFQRARLWEVELGGEDRDVARPRRLRGDLRGLVERRALDLARLVDLEDVPLAQVVEAVEEDAALESLGDLAGVVLEALELSDRRLVDSRTLAED